MKNNLFKAAISHYEAQKDEALAILEIYFTNPVAIGEHSGILKEILEWTQKLSEAEENINSLKKHFSEESS